MLNLYFFILDHFESACINYFNFFLNDFFFIVLSSSLLYMLQTFLIFFFLQMHYLFFNFSNIISLIMNSFIFFINDIVINYITYVYNIFFIFISFIFIWIFINNILGLLPFSNTINNHLNITGMISFIFWLGSVFIGFKCFNTYFISLFVVNGIPRMLIPFLGGIEMLSYFFIFISLSLRLFSNIVSGHICFEYVINLYIFVFLCLIYLKKSLFNSVTILINKKLVNFPNNTNVFNTYFNCFSNKSPNFNKRFNIFYNSKKYYHTNISHMKQYKKNNFFSIQKRYTRTGNKVKGVVNKILTSNHIKNKDLTLDQRISKSISQNNKKLANKQKKEFKKEFKIKEESYKKEQEIKLDQLNNINKVNIDSFNKVLTSVIENNNSDEYTLITLNNYLNDIKKKTLSDIIKYKELLIEIENKYPFLINNSDISFDLVLFLKKGDGNESVYFYESAFYHYIKLSLVSFINKSTYKNEKVLYKNIITSLKKWESREKDKKWFDQNVDNQQVIPSVKLFDVFTNTKKDSTIHSSILFDRSIVVKIKDIDEDIIGYTVDNNHFLNLPDLDNILNVYLKHNILSIVDKEGNFYLSRELLSKSDINNLDKEEVGKVSSCFTEPILTRITSIDETKEIFHYFTVSNTFNSLEEEIIKINDFHKFLSECHIIIEYFLKYDSSLTIGNTIIKNPNTKNILVPFLENYNKQNPFTIKNEFIKYNYDSVNNVFQEVCVINEAGSNIKPCISDANKVLSIEIDNKAIDD